LGRGYTLREQGGLLLLLSDAGHPPGDDLVPTLAPLGQASLGPRGQAKKHGAVHGRERPARLGDGDDLRLFAESSDVRELIKQKEVLEVLEIATDRCDDVANTLESIVIKTT